jgi:imidazolonepropionase-like amidohydrolase
MHVHALWDSAVAEAFLPEFVRAGVTGVRDMGGRLEVLTRTRSMVESYDRNWPRVVAAGPVLDGPEPVDPSISIAVGTPQEARRAVDDLAADGVDFIKVYTLLPRDAYFAAVERARALGLPVVGHVPAGVSVREAVVAGQIGIEHLRDELEPFCHQLDPNDCRELLQLFRASSVVNTPTLAVLEAKSIPGYRPEGASEAGPEVPDVVMEFWNGSAISHRGRGEEYFVNRRAVFAEEMALVGELRRAGATILAGSDAGNPFVYPGGGLHRELELLVEAGLSAREALFSATIEPVRFLGLVDSVGGVRPGLSADLVLLDRNPLEDISNVRTVTVVVLRGRPIEVRR